MKKNVCFVFFLIVLCCICLISCGPKYSFNKEELLENTSTVYLINVNNQDYANFPEDCYDIIQEIDKGSLEQFLIALSEVEFNQVYGDPMWANGECIKILYNDGSFSIIGLMIIENYNNKNEQISFMSKCCPEAKFNELKNYFNK